MAEGLPDLQVGIDVVDARLVEIEEISSRISDASNAVLQEENLLLKGMRMAYQGLMDGRSFEEIADEAKSFRFKGGDRVGTPKGVQVFGFLESY